MAYNLESLMKILNLTLQSDPWILDPNAKPEIESLLKRAQSLNVLFASLPVGDYRVKRLESRIRDAAHEAEDVLESQLVDRILSARNTSWIPRIFLPILSFLKGRSSRIYLPILSFFRGPMFSPEIIEEFEYVKMEIERINEDGDPTGPSRADPNPSNILVGMSEHLEKLKKQVKSDDRNLNIIPIIGMGGIGKTTLAQLVYDYPDYAYHFDIRAWITIRKFKGSEDSLKIILTSLLGCVLGILTDKMREKENEELGERLRKRLFDRRYLIVLDNMWVTDDWDDVIRFLPDNQNGSRIMITTRENNVAKYVARDSFHYQMTILNIVDSWDLLRRKVFEGGGGGGEEWLRELEKIGKKIAWNCKGLPLVIHAIGGVLSQVKRTRKSWSNVARGVGKIVAKDEQSSGILSLSYNHLPIHLKPCFLYMGAFHEDAEIRRSKLIRLWVAEGFLKPIQDKSLEEAADVYLNALVDRNLIYVRQKAPNGCVKSYGIHDLLRDLCLRKACEEKFFHVINRNMWNRLEDTECPRRVTVDSYYCRDDCILQGLTTTNARSLLHSGNGPCRIISTHTVKGLRLLKVLDILRIKLESIPDEMLELVNLRYLALASTSHLSSSISAIQNLETVIFEYRGPRSTPCNITFPSPHVKTAILDLPRLQHLIIKNVFYPCEQLLLKENLQSLSGIEINDGFFELLKSVPNLKKLGCRGPICFSEERDISHLHNLESFKCRSQSISHPSSFFFKFPPSLRKVTLRDFKLVPHHLTVFGNLQNLQVLKLRHCSIANPTWVAYNEIFEQLCVLFLEISNLENWEADEESFPKLERLVVKGCSKLEGIPGGIGEIPTLKTIEVHKSSHTAVDSARRILDKNKEDGYNDLELNITT